ncbi:pyridoxal-phosphate dependent enzyme [Rhodoferax sp.]|uniref:pyridoxal-phosphate dependent enzyme n=1 Tax=Rhodoferax sp. TaxID=50421 RepID=UPI0026016DEC|nr:pyridoxal-phosphate dependent enzyme [Rhodoferax sp.]MDD2926941.1 pyridoxal-phosphate dependent enzyme [Rhodoferax sp.]
MSHLHIQTPYFESRALSHSSGRSVWLKMEALQPPGSFKIRGVGLKCQEAVKQGATRLISSSGGNAGIAVAYAGRQLSIPVTVVVPETTTDRAKALIRQENADVVVHGASWQEANALAVSMVGAGDAFVHPFDDALLWRGHASMVDEMAQAADAPDAIVLSVGGGGLLCGVLEGLHRNGWSGIPVIAVETRGADSLAQAVKAGYPIELPAIQSIASSLGARQVAQQAFDWTTRHTIHSVVVSDQQAVRACESFIQDQRIVVEPACGAALAAVYDHVEEIRAYQKVAVIVCGGVTATLAHLKNWGS